MALPPGFNPSDMSFGNIVKRPPVIEIPRNTSTYTSYSSLDNSCHTSLWSRFNNGVASIGNCFADKSQIVLGLLSLIAMAIIFIICVANVIVTWIEQGFWSALFIAFIAGVVGVVLWYVAAFVIVIGVNVVMYGLRFVFWNAWTLLIVIMISIGGWWYIAANRHSYPTSHVGTTMPTYNRYRCTTKALNVRIYPNKKSKKIGVLRRGQEVEVFDIEDSFAAIEYNGQRGYVSLKYLDKID